MITVEELVDKLSGCEPKAPVKVMLANGDVLEIGSNESEDCAVFVEDGVIYLNEGTNDES